MDLERARRLPFVSRGQSAPQWIVKAEGAYLYTDDGQKILDASGGAIVGNIGYGRDEVVDAVAKTLRDTSYVVPGYATDSRVALVERVADHWLPDGMTRANFCSGGSESVDSALRLARVYHLARGNPERWKVIGRDMSYHGVTLATLGVGGNAGRRAGFEPWYPEVAKAPAHYPLRCSIAHEHDACAMAAADALAGVIEEEGPETVAAFIAEPVVGASAGVLIPPDGYWQRVREICDRYEVLLIADEVMCGFGRTGKNFAVEHWHVTPDIMTGGKGLAGGYAPIGGIYATDDVIGPIADAGMGLMFFTFGAHPASCAAADKVLEIMEREELVARSAEVGDKLRKRLAYLEQHANVAEVRGIGLFLGVELVRDRATMECFDKDVSFARRVLAEARRRGVAIYPAGSGRMHDAVMLGPPFVIGDEEIELIAGVLGESIDAAVSAVG